MAPNGHAATDSATMNGQSGTNSSKPWYEKNGREEYKIWQKAHPLNHISYEKWKVSKYVEGISLYYATLDIFEESESSDDDAEQTDTKRRARNARGPAARESKKSSMTNGNGSSRTGGSATPSGISNLIDPDTSGRKKRKPRKKPKSQEVIASEGDSDEVEEVATPLESTITPSGNRKSSNRKPRKKPLSEEIISPEDEEDDPMAVDTPAGLAIASPLPVRSAPNVPTAARSSEQPRKTILKLTTKRTPKKKVLSDDIVRDDMEEERLAKLATTSMTQPSVTAEAEHDITAALESHLVHDFDDNASVGPEGETAAEAATRRGLRTRRPAQRKPYSYDARLYEEDEPEVPESSEFTSSSPPRQSSKAPAPAPTSAQAPAPVPAAAPAPRPTLFDHYYRGEDLQTMDAEVVAILKGIEMEPDYDPRGNKPKHFKGKGRAWKKEESDEDLEFNPGKKKRVGRPSTKTRGSTGKKRGRPRKSNVSLSEDIVRDDSDSDAGSKTGDTSILDTATPALPEKIVKKMRRPLRPVRKSALSEEVVRDESDEGEEKREKDTPMVDVSVAETTTASSPKHDEPHKSNQSTTSSESSNRTEENGLRTPKETSMQPTASEELRPISTGKETPFGSDKAEEPAFVTTTIELTGPSSTTTGSQHAPIIVDDDEEL